MTATRNRHLFRGSARFVIDGEVFPASAPPPLDGMARPMTTRRPSTTVMTDADFTSVMHVIRDEEYAPLA